MSDRLCRLFRGLALAALLVAGCSNDPDDGADADTGPAPDVADAGDTGGADADTAGIDADTTGADAETGLDVPDVDADAARDIDGDAIRVDADTSSDTDGGPTCMDDQQCPGNAVCEEGDCRFYRFVQIKDVTRQESSGADTACSEESSGADLFQLELRDPFGQVLGYAAATAGELNADANTKPDDVFDGVGHSLKETDDGNLCPSGGFGPDSVVSLGCGGSLVVGFSDGAGNILNLATGQQLVVHEYGNQCCARGCPEEYWEIRVCNAQSPQRFRAGEVDEKGNHPTCATALVEIRSGRGQVSLQLPRN